MPPHYSHLNVERHFETGSESDSYHIGINGGTMAGLAGDSPSAANSPRTTFGVFWAGDELVIEKGSYSGGQSGRRTHHREVWRLDRSGRLVITITERASEASTSVHTLTYRKQ